MKKTIIITLLMLIFLTSLLAVSSTAATKPIRWRLQSYAGPTLNAQVCKNSIDKFNIAANGEMLIDVYSADELVPHGELFHALQDGTVDMALSDDYSIGSPADVAVFTAYFPIPSRIGLDVDVLWEHYGLNEIWKEAYDEIPGVTWLAQGSWDPCYIASTKPIRHVEDLKGLRIFASLFSGKFLKEQFGVVPVVMPVEDVEMALQTGMLDGVSWSGITELYEIGWADTCDYLLTNPISGAWSGGWFVNTKSWEAIPPHLQQLLKLAIADSNYYRLHWYWNGEASQKAHGGKFEFTTIPADEWTTVEDQREKYWDEYAKKSPRSARVMQAFKDYSETMKAAGPPYH